MARRVNWSTGVKGRNRVSLRTHDRTGLLFLDWQEGGKRTKRSLGHTDLKQGKRAAEDEAARLLASVAAPIPRAGTGARLKDLLDLYLKEKTPFKGRSAQQQDRSAFPLFEACFGPAREVMTLSVRDWDKFIAMRRDGSLSPPKGRGPVKNRQIELELTRLMTVFNWATVALNDGGEPLLPRNPFKGLTRPKELNPHRPRLKAGQYEAMLKAARQVSDDLVLALQICDDTGHRIQSVRMLRWSDFDLTQKAIHWRKGPDKIGFEHWTAMSPALSKVLTAARVARAKQGRWRAEGFVFQSDRTPDAPWSREEFYDWWHQAEEIAKLKGKLPARAGFHCLRRKMASELALEPLAAVKALGGWLHPDVVVGAYQELSFAQQRQVMKKRQR